ncbi:hypothetical protein QBC47DRAFT_330378 [Echria macrotheca]|uniref:DUF2828 domain-containing protein n=1 Tax=Echria macrotheca TaxID=438768 RepID=A0AAJ0B5Y8_9PEZI|nr:hypothetical protein QBC47DRAFT_330378 [Echria macrotheca]
MAAQQQMDEQWFLKAKCPVFLPRLDALTLPTPEFEARLTDILNEANAAAEDAQATPTNDVDSLTLVSEPSSTTADATGKMKDLAISHKVDDVDTDTTMAGHPFVDGLRSFDQTTETEVPDMENKMLTENNAVAYASTQSPLVDLFHELEDVVTGPRLHDLLNAAWAEDPSSTLKIIFNARSIHLGKGSRATFYRCAGWLAQYHPRTLLANLRWLSRPVIPKKVNKDEEDMVVVPSELDPSDPARFDIDTGVAHGYWKDLLNILALSANKKLNVLADSRDILNIEREGGTGLVSAAAAKEKRLLVRKERHDAVMQDLKSDPRHLALHLTVARLFAEQLAADMALLRGSDEAAKKHISLCAKWAPSTDRFHDKHTFVVSSIAEIMYPEDHFVQKGLLTPSTTDLDRTVYLRYAREWMRRDVSALRNHLEIVERDITEEKFENIKYDRVPSIAMRNYANLFASKDTDRFEQYLEGVASGKAKISGATLLPSTLIKGVREGLHQTHSLPSRPTKKKRGAKNSANVLQEGVAERIAEMERKVVDGQWKTLVQRIRDSGSMDSCIAVCDVSGSMGHPVFPDGTCPMDSAIGLSLLIAEVVAPPFQGCFITFSEHPEVQRINISGTLREKVREINSSDWGMNTDFEAVFLKLILPMAVKNNLKPEDMVKRIFVFSDMQFDEATGVSNWGSKVSPWSTTYERIKSAYAEAGYPVPEMVFWNLAGGRHGVAPKPVTAGDEGVALVSGYSQAMLKVFLGKGMFEEEEEEEEKIVEVEDGDLVAVEKAEKRIDPLSIVKKAISHKAFSMLDVVD